jgi:hypothetical protein
MTKKTKARENKDCPGREKPMTEVAFNTKEKGPDEWDLLLSRSSY